LLNKGNKILERANVISLGRLTVEEKKYLLDKKRFLLDEKNHLLEEKKFLVKARVKSATSRCFASLKTWKTRPPRRF
jgi:hypothetical protein